MFLHFWRWWCDNHSGTTRANRRVYNAPGRSFRPRLEPLEDRCLPAPLFASLVGDVPRTVPGAAGPVGVIRPGSAAAIQVNVTVPRNSRDSVQDLSTVLSGWEGWRYQDPPRISVVRNTNRALVTTRLTDTQLKLSYTAGMTGTALVTVGLTDAAGVSAQITFFITVQPRPVAALAQLPAQRLT
jgi:hypothetical protein